MKSVLVAAAILATGSFGQSASSTTAAASASSATTPTTTAAELSATESSSTRTPTTTTVSVGLNHDFNPDSIIAEPGDVIKFIFYPTNHSVVRAAYENPCIPYNYVNPGGDTFFSGPKISSTGDEQPVWLLTVNNTDPIFFYCSAPGSCISSHMVGAINPNDTYTLAAQKAALADVKYQLSPGESIPSEYGTTTGTGLGSTSTPSSSSSEQHGSSLSAGAIAGIAIGGAVVLIGAVALIWFCGRKGGIEKGYRKSTVANPPSASMIESNYNGHPKSPPPPMYRDSSHYAQSEAPYRSMSPAQWSQTGSPHMSYAGYPSPGLTSQWSDVHGQSEAPKSTSPGPVELMGNTHHPDSAAGRHEFPA
ncbi:hypothetical protein PFICI_01020 [Pestalotiopsis fici W106-1]|uniref:Phytocyanin domain-containing protein n=1 Tax=Pestalotiopsis fici (strain W106-1 / CGMCC3.15140) TaxID=1229662 RepID=W3XNV6_PESFW|nr:uncharacterized protein PFICI_01020 [Pestalotiopsis fici W106-1]ETS87192.1 hypothetical protein PFICI_01020 [Pestalotiopsis fici W106-1]